MRGTYYGNFRILSLLFFCGKLFLFSVGAQVIVVGGSTGNGDFNADTSGTDARTFSDTPHWYNLLGDEATQATRRNGNTSANENGDDTRNAVITIGRTFINDTSYTVTAAGEVFQVSLDWRDAFGWDDHIDRLEMFFFTEDSNVVSSNTAYADITEIGPRQFISAVRFPDDFEPESRPSAYTTTAADIGKQIFVGVEAPVSANEFARFDNVRFEVIPAPVPPGNDAFVNRTPIGPALPISIQSTNRDARLELGEPRPSVVGSRAQNSVWFTWTSPITTNVVFDTAGSAFDTVLAIWTGNTLLGLTEVASNDSNDVGLSFSAQSRFGLFAQQGVTYHIALYGYNGTEGNYNLDITQANTDVILPQFSNFRFVGFAGDAALSDVTVTARVDVVESGGAEPALGHGSRVADVSVRESDDQAFRRSNATFIFAPSHLISGNATNGTYETTVVLPRFTPPGTWEVSGLSLYENGSRVVNLPSNSPLLPDATFVVPNSNPDTQGPLLTGVQVIPPPSGDAALGDLNVTLRLSIQDALSGFAGGQIQYQLPGGRSVIGTVTNTQLVAGDANSGDYEITLVIPQHTPPGMATLSDAHLLDLAGISRAMTSRGTDRDFGAIGLPNAPFTIVNSTPDISPPQLTSLSITPQIVPTNEFTQISVEVGFSDSQTGFESIQILFEPDGIFSSGRIDGSTTAHLDQGDAQSGSLAIPQFVFNNAQPGIYCIRSISYQDVAGNRVGLGGQVLKEALAAIGGDFFIGVGEGTAGTDPCPAGGPDSDDAAGP